MIRVRSLLAVLALAVAGGAARADGLDTAELYKKVVKSCVYIITPMKGGYSMGSGSLIDADQKIVLTNHHVVDENEIVFVMFPMYRKDGSMITDKDSYMALIPENKALKGKVLSRDKKRDLAFVKVDKVPDGTGAIPLARRSAVSGASTWNIGSPGDVPKLFSFTQGVVRTVGWTKIDLGTNIVEGVIVTATNPTNPGDSGGPLFNKYGQQIAVTQSGYSGRAVQQVNMFIDVSEVRTYLKEQKITIKELVGEDGNTIEPGKPTGVGKKDGELPVAPPKDTVLKTPPVAKTPTAKAETPTPKVDTAPAPAAADEEAAAARLRYAKNVASGSATRYAEILAEIIKKWPGTKAAKEAEQIKKTLK